MFKNLLVPTDGSKLSMKAVDQALAMAKTTGATLTVMTVVPPYPAMYAGDGYVIEPMSTKAWEKAMKDSAEKTLDVVGRRAKAQDVP